MGRCIPNALDGASGRTPILFHKSSHSQPTFNVFSSPISTWVPNFFPSRFRIFFSQRVSAFVARFNLKYLICMGINYSRMGFPAIDPCGGCRLICLLFPFNSDNVFNRDGKNLSVAHKLDAESANVARFLSRMARRVPGHCAVKVPLGLKGDRIEYLERSFAQMEADCDAVARFFQAVPHRLPWDGANHQPRASITTVITKNGQVSTCNEGAKASPADVPPRTPSKPGTTHHQGSGSSPLSRLTNGFSICSNFIVWLRFSLRQNLNATRI